MAITVPRSTQRQVQETAAPNIRIDPGGSAEAFGAGASNQKVQSAADGLFDQTQKILAAEKAKADEVVLTEFNSKLTHLKNELIYNPKTGLMNRKGRDAFGASESVHSDYDSQVEELKKSLSSRSQEEMANKMIIGHKTDLDGDIEKHIYAESKAYDDETTQAALLTAHDDAVLNYQNPEKVQAALDNQAGTVLRWAKRNGYPDNDPITLQKLEQAASKTHSAIVERMLGMGDDLQAKAYFDSVKAQGGQFTGQDMVSVEKALEEGSVRGQSERNAKAIYSQHTDMAQALREADAIDNVKVKDETRRRIKERFADADSSRRDSNEKNHINALNILDNSKNIDDVMKSPMWKNFTQGERNGLINYAKMKAEGIQPARNGEDYYNLKIMAATPELQSKFLKTNIREYVGKVTDSELHELINLQTNGRVGKGMNLDGFRSNQDIVKGTLKDFGFNPNAKPGTDEIKKVNQFLAKVDQAVMKEQERTGKKITNDEIKRISDNLMIEGTTDNGIFGSGFFAGKKRLFEIDPSTKQFKIESESIPIDERNRIEEALKRNNRPITDMEVLRLYKRKIGGLASGN